MSRRKVSPQQVRAAQKLYREYVEARDAKTLDLCPWMAPCVCTCGIHAHKGEGNRGKCTGCTTCNRYRANVVDQLLRYALDGAETPFTTVLAQRDAEEYAARPRKQRGPGEWSVRASDLDACQRWLWYRNVEPEGYTPVKKSVGPALAGKVIEEAMSRINAELYPWREHQRQVEVKGLSSPGLIDEWDRLIGRVTDFKSVGVRGWERIETYGPPEKHRGQLGLYASELEREGEWVNDLELRYINRDNFEEMVFTYRWDDEMRAFVETCRDTLIGYLTTLDIAARSNEAPEREGNGPGSWPCNYCEALEHCWNVEAARAQGRTPQSLTLLGKLDEEKIAWAGEQILAARAEKDAAEKRYNAVNALIDWSVVPATYGGVRVQRGQPGKIKQGELAQAYFEEAQRRGVDLSDVPIPRGEPGKPIVMPAKRKKPDIVPDPPVVTG